MKEAYIKALGIGLGFELHRAKFHYREDLIWGDIAYVYIDGIYQVRWQFFLHKLDSDHWVSLHHSNPLTYMYFFGVPKLAKFVSKGLHSWV